MLLKEKTMTKNTIEIDGSYGEGGGQIIRTALALSLITQTPIQISNIRAGRKKSGLLRQHLACVKASKAIGQAIVTGDELGSSSLYFSPQCIQAGNYEFDIGSAGSTLLVLQTVLPALMLQNNPSRIGISGGTHNPMAPPVEYIQHTFIPLLAKLGFQIEIECQQAGFAPIGGGSIVCHIQPYSVTKKLPLALDNRGDLQAIEAFVVLANLSADIAKREFNSMQSYLSQKLPQFTEVGGFSCKQIIEYQGKSNGNMAVVVMRSSHFNETFTILGEKRLSAEKVGKRLAGQVTRYLQQSACVDEYTADQLLLPLALTNGGSFTARIISEHTRTQAYMIEKFLSVKITISDKKIEVIKLS